jgi:VanZ family protein
VALVAAAGIALSASVESVQLLTIDRVPSLGDVVWDTLGCLLGAGLAVRFLPHIHRGFATLRAHGWTSVPELRAVGIALVALAAASWQPFDVTLEIGSIARKLRFLADDPWQFWGWRRAGTSFMLSAFLATSLAGYLANRGTGRAGRRAVALGTAIVFVLEAGQLFVDSRMPGLADPLLASAGVAAGAAIWVMAGSPDRPGVWLGVATALTLACASVQVLARTASLTRLEAVSRTTDLALLFFPLGCWIGQATPDRGRAYGIGVVLALALALATAAVQQWARGTYPDVTLAGLSLAGLVLGVYSGSPRP